jgi:hypothetical protein
MVEEEQVMPDETYAVDDEHRLGFLQGFFGSDLRVNTYLTMETERDEARADLARVQQDLEHARALMRVKDRGLEIMTRAHERQAEEIAALRGALEVARFYVAIASERTDRNVYADLAIVNIALAPAANVSPAEAREG